MPAYTRPRPPICTVSLTALTNSSHKRATKFPALPLPSESTVEFRNLRLTSSTVPPPVWLPLAPAVIRCRRRTRKTKDSSGKTTKNMKHVVSFARDIRCVSASSDDRTRARVDGGRGVGVWSGRERGGRGSGDTAEEPEESNGESAIFVPRLDLVLIAERERRRSTEVGVTVLEVASDAIEREEADVEVCVK